MLSIRGVCGVGVVNVMALYLVDIWVVVIVSVLLGGSVICVLVTLMGVVGVSDVD